MMEISKRNKIIISTIFIMFFMAVVYLPAESIWEGSAAMGRYGEFPFTGYYGASNSFPQNSFVEVENLENGKRTRLIIVDRLSDSGLLMLVSNEAAQEIGIYQNDIARIKVRIITTGNTVEKPQIDDLAYNPDPDLNPAAALMTQEELLSQDTIDVKTAIEPESDFSVLTELSPRTEDLAEAEILVVEEEIPTDIAVDTPEKPFDWPDTVKVVPEEAEVPEPLYLTEDEVPLNLSADLENEGLEISSPALELMSSGLGNAEPVYSGEENFNMSTLPEIAEKASNEDVEYITEASDYHKPVIKEAGISVKELPVPELEILEDILSVLVGDHLLISETEPENVEVDDAFYDKPEIVYTDDSSASVLALDLMDANPLVDDGTSLIAEAFPTLPGGDNSTLIEVANGYISPGEAEYTAEINDYPDYAVASEPAEVPIVEDELVPEYDENVEISLVPAEVRPPEPEIEKIETTVTVAVAPSAEVVMVSKLQQQRHYLQLGAFKEKNSAIKAAGKLEAVYPVTILTDESTASYKLLLGPLSADESGIMLYNFRAGGYSDAFIRRIE